MKELFSVEKVKNVIYNFEPDINGSKIDLPFFASQCFFKQSYPYLSQKILRDFLLNLYKVKQEFMYQAKNFWLKPKPCAKSIMYYS